MLSTEEIKALLPHRYPFLLVDQIQEMEAGVRAVGIKNVTVNEPFFPGHFPQKAVMPGVLIVEAMAQVGACAILSLPDYQGKLVLFAGIDQARFRRQVVPGDRLVMEVEVLKMRGAVGKAKGTARVDGQVAAEAQLTFAVEK